MTTTTVRPAPLGQATAAIRKVTRHAARMVQIAGAFLRMGWQLTLSYPLSLVMTQLAALVPPVIYFFVASLVSRSGADVGGDYYTFVIIGMVSVQLLSAALQGLGNELQQAVQQGRFEMLLVEPVRWRVLPFGMALYEMILRSITAGGIVLISLLLGARYDPAGIPAAILIVALGMLAGLGIGILSASLKILAKRADPILVVYTLAASVFSGVFFPVSMIPAILQPISWLIPHTYMIGALRRVLMPAGDAMPGLSALEAILCLVAFNLIVYPAALWLFGRSLDYGRRMGLLSGY